LVSSLHYSISAVYDTVGLEKKVVQTKMETYTKFSRLGNQTLWSPATVSLTLKFCVRKLKMGAGINMAKLMLMAGNGLATAPLNATAATKKLPVLILLDQLAPMKMEL